MAYADYRHCDVCDCKVFYDANLNYDHFPETGEVKLERLGAWAVICVECAKTHEVVIQKKAATKEKKP